MSGTGFYDEIKTMLQQNNEPDFDGIIAKKASYEYLYYLSRLRANIIDWLPLTKEMSILEWNAGCGALTGSLLKKSGHIVSVAECGEEAEILRLRYAGFRAFEVMTKEAFFSQKKTDEDCRYDVILLIGFFDRYRNLLNDFYKMLKKGGILVIADSNRMGLKYFAGNQEEYQGGYFTGIENYPDGGDKERCYTAKEYEGFLTEAGFADVIWHYPYPDHKFTTDIYSKEWLPHRGELTDCRRNFDRDRYLLFDEGKVFDTLLAEGLFPSFSNSFLIEAYKEIKKDFPRIVYSRFSNERKECFQIRTDIRIEADGTKKVYKYALNPEGKEHIRRIETSEKELNHCYGGDHIIFCPCAVSGDGIGFPFICGKTLQDILEEALSSGKEELILGILKDYIRRLYTEGGDTVFVMTEGFREVFGEAEFLGKLSCPLYCDIDMIFSNIIVGDGWERQDIGGVIWNVIDYEWAFAFPVPKAFLIYRALYFAYYQIFKGTDLTLERLMEMAKITEHDRHVFLNMEEHFQRYLGQSRLPVRNMQRMMGTKIKRMDEPFVPEKKVFAGRILFHIDREEFQDGCAVVSGWAFGKTLFGEALPVKIRVFGADKTPLCAEITRTKRPDVMNNFKLREITEPYLGFDCVFPIGEHEKWKVTFSVGGLKKHYESGSGFKG